MFPFLCAIDVRSRSVPFLCVDNTVVSTAICGDERRTHPIVWRFDQVTTS